MTPPLRAGRVLVLGADGFIGRHVIFALQRAGMDVVACARRPERLRQMGFDTLQADLEDPATHTPSFWENAVENCAGIVNAAGLLTGSDVRFRAVHHSAPTALYQAVGRACPIILISATGIDNAETRFARHRVAGEKLALDHGAMVLRPGLVLGDTSYGGSSLLRALAAVPCLTPVVGDGTQPFNPIHADDLAGIVVSAMGHSAGSNAATNDVPKPGIVAAGGPQTLSQTDMIRAYQAWLGLPERPVVRIPLPLARGIGKAGDLLRLGPVSATSVAQLTAGVLSTPDPDLPAVRSFDQFHRSRPAGTQDLWQARLYLLRPLVRFALVLLWFVSGLLGLLLSPETFLPLAGSGAIPDLVLIALARLGGCVDLTIAYAVFRGVRPGLLAGIQVMVVLSYTVGLTILAPALWLLPLGGLLKNVPVLVLIVVHAILEDER